MACRYRFHEFELLPAPPFLLRDGQPVAVSSQVLALLRHLVARPGTLVSKAELLEQVWGHDHLTDAAFARAVMRTRKLLGDDGQEQRFIRTVHGRGVMFVAPVEVLAPEPSNARPDSETRSDQTVPPAPPSRRWLIPGLVLLVLAGGAAFWGRNVGWSQPPARSEAPSERAVVLQSIVSESDDAEGAALVAGLPRYLADRLAPLGVRLLHADERLEPEDVEAWRSVAGRSADVFGDSTVLALRVGRAAGGRFAEVRFVGADLSALRVQATDPPALARDLAATLGSRLSGQAIGEPLTSTEGDPVLDELELRARAAWGQGDAETALRALDAALALRPDALSLAALRLEVLMADAAPPAALVAELTALLDQADANLDPLTRAMLLQRAGVHAWHAGDAELSIDLLEPALRAVQQTQAPMTEALIRNALSIAQQSRGDIEGAWDNARLAVDALRDPQRPYHLAMALTNLGYLAEDRGRIEGARRWQAEALALREGFGFSRQVAASQYALARVARRSGALTEAERLVRAAAETMAQQEQVFERISALEELAVIAILRGQHDTAERWLDEAVPLAESMDDALGLAWLADVRGRLRLAQGRPAEAVALLESAWTEQLRLGEAHEARYTRIALLDALWRRALAGDLQAADAASSIDEALTADQSALGHDQQVALAVVRLRNARHRAPDPAAEEACRHALALARTSGAVDHEAEAALECALLHFDRGDTEAGEAMLRVARAWSSEWQALRDLPLSESARR